MKKTVRLILLFVIFVITACFVITGSADNTEYALYKNDTKFSFDEYPAINLDGEIHVPSSLFIGFKNVLYEYNPKYESFYFLNKDTGNYFAFSFNTENIIVDGDFTQKSFPIINSTIYVPIDYCAGILSLKVEYKKTDDVTHIRLSDGTESLDFDELLELFAPPPVTPDDPITPPDHPTPPDTPIDTKKKNVYLLVELSDTQMVKKTIDIIRAFGERATLFFTNEALMSNPFEVYNAITGGNSIGICAPQDSVDPVSYIKNANMTLEHIANFSSRFYLANDRAQSIGDGYIACIPTIDVDDYSDLSSTHITTRIYNDAIAHSDSTVKIKATEKNFNTLMAILGLFANDELVELKVLNTSYPESN